MGGRAARRILIVAVLLVGLLVVADRVGLYIAERSAGSTIQSSQGLRDRPDVDIAGLPFLTQLAAGEFDEITVTATDVPLGSDARALQISRVRVVLHTITVARDFSRVHAADATATARITFAELGQALDVDLSYAGNGRIRASKTVTVAGTSIKGAMTTQPRLVNGALGFARTAVDGGGPLIDALASTLGQVFDVSLPLQGIPFKIRVRALQVDAQGVLVTLTGSNLTYSN